MCSAASPTAVVPLSRSHSKKLAACLEVVLEDEEDVCVPYLGRSPSMRSDSSSVSGSGYLSPPTPTVDEAVCKIARCRSFCEQIAQTAAMHSPPVTATEINLARLLQQAMQEIQQQLHGIESEVSRVVPS